MKLYNEINFEKLVLTDLVIYFQFSLLRWRIYLYIYHCVYKLDKNSVNEQKNFQKNILEIIFCIYACVDSF